MLDERRSLPRDISLEETFSIVDHANTAQKNTRNMKFAILSQTTQLSYAVQRPILPSYGADAVMHKVFYKHRK